MDPGVAVSLISYSLLAAVVLALCTWLLRRRKLTGASRAGVWILVACALALPATAFIGRDQCRSVMGLAKSLDLLGAPEAFLVLMAALGIAARWSRQRKGVVVAAGIAGCLCALCWLFLAVCNVKG